MIQQVNNWYRRFLSDPQSAFLALMLIMGLAVVILMGGMLLPVIAAVVIAYLLDDFVMFMERRGSHRLRSISLVFMIFMALLIFVFFGLAPLLSGQVTQFLQELPAMVSQGQEALQRLPRHYPFITDAQIQDFNRAISDEIDQFGRTALSSTLSYLPGIITLLVYLVLLPLLVFFFLKDKEMIMGWIGDYLPRERDLMLKVWEETDKKIGGYLRGKFWEILIVGTVSSVVFFLLDLNYALLLGALVGLSVVVPFIGATVVTFPVVIIAYFQWGWGSEMIYVTLAYAIIQTLDASVLVPVLFSGTVNLHPVAIIVAVLFFGGLWGFWGVFFAIPLAALVQVILMVWPRKPLGDRGLPADQLRKI